VAGTVYWHRTNAARRQRASSCVIHFGRQSAIVRSRLRERWLRMSCRALHDPPCAWPSTISGLMLTPKSLRSISHDSTGLLRGRLYLCIWHPLREAEGGPS